MAGTKGDKTVLRALGLGGLYGGGAEGMIDVKDGKILRVRPFRFDWKYERSKVRGWKFEKDGKKLEASWKSMPSPYSLAYKKRVYSPNRIKYPLIRVDWDPNGERNPQNRGKSKFRRATWDEATTIIANEIRRVHAKYGVNAILMQGDGHGECKTINTPHGQPGLLLDHMGGFTLQVRNPDSWEGWYWGAKHVWGQGVQGMYWPAANIVKDSTEHTQMCLFWGCDPETTPWGFTGQFASKLMYFWKDIGIKQVYVCPDLNYGAAVHADKWIPVLPNTDAALQLAIAYMWIKEGSYDKEYVDTHVVGFDKFSDYIMGKTDGVPKTPAWAAPKCGVPEWTIKALARQWSKLRTSTAHYFGGGYVRGPWSHEPGRLEVCLLGMQGLGKPGVHQHQMSYWGMPRAEGLAGTSFWNPDIAERLAIPPLSSIANWQESGLPKTLVHTHLLSEEPLKFTGMGAIEGAVANQFVKHQFPIATKDGARIHMMWTDCPCRVTCWNGGNDTERALRSPQVECIVTQHPWLENDTLWSDIILPANTYMEVDDIITNVRQGGQWADVMLCDKAIEPIGESKSDYEIVLEIAKKLGYEKQVSEGLTTLDLQKKIFGYMGLERMTTWEEFREKGYYLYQTAPDWEKDTPGWRKFADDPAKHPLGTPSKKLEFYSERLAKHFPDDKERPPSPQWIEKSEMHDERLSSPRAKQYPLLLISNHGRWRVHAQCDDISWTREAPTCKVLGVDGYKYEPIWLHTSEAAKRDIKHGDIIKIFNERGIVLGGAYVTERLRSGVAYIDHGARADPIIIGKVDRGGAINTIAPTGTTSKNAVGQATSGYLVEVAKVTGAEWDEWRAANPEAFTRPYDPAAGLRFEAWVVKQGGAK
jgi:anaerobic selenocysteine-containing dehydrogenase